MAIIALAGRISSGKDTVGSMLQFLMHTEGKWDQTYFEDLQKRPAKGISFNFQNFWLIKKFAGKLKTIASLLTGIPVHRFEDQDFKNSYLGEEWWTQGLSNVACPNPDKEGTYARNPMTVRELLQRLGTEAIRNGLHPNAWINALYADYYESRVKHYVDDIPEYRNELPNWIITDLRFPNEFDSVKERKGVCVRVVRRFEDFQVKDTQVRKEVNPIDLHPSETALDNRHFDFVIENSGTLDDLRMEVTALYHTLKHMNLI